MLADARRRERLRARATLWQLSKVRRLRGCGRSVRSSDGVSIRASGAGADRSAGFSGLATCGSVWSCPECSAKIARERQSEIHDALAEWHARGGRVAMVTLTMRHHRRHGLRELWDGLSKAWHRTTSGRAWKDEQRQHGTPMPRTIRSGARAGQVVVEDRIPTVRLVEVTRGKNGWHVHVHALLLLDGETSREDVTYLGDQMFTRWRDALGAAGLPRPTHEHGVDARRLDGDAAAATAADYFTKTNYAAALEAARSDLKRARGGNITPFGMLALLTTGEVHDSVDVDALGDVTKLWHEWEDVSRARRQIAWTPGLREHLGLRAERDDETIAEDDAGGDVVARIAPAVWRTIATPGRYAQLAGDLLAAACADDDGTAVRALLATIPPAPPRRSPWALAVPAPRAAS